jgi:hypothetical protein
VARAVGFARAHPGRRTAHVQIAALVHAPQARDPVLIETGELVLDPARGTEPAARFVERMQARRREVRPGHRGRQDRQAHERRQAVVVGGQGRRAEGTAVGGRGGGPPAQFLQKRPRARQSREHRRGAGGHGPGREAASLDGAGQHPGALALAGLREQSSQRFVHGGRTLVDGERPAQGRHGARLVAQAQEQPARGARLILAQPRLGATARPDPGGFVQQELVPLRAARLPRRLDVALGEGLSVAPVEARDERAEAGRETLEVLGAAVLAVAEPGRERGQEALPVARATAHVSGQSIGEQRLPRHLVPGLQVDVERVPRDVVVAVVLDRPVDELLELLSPAVAFVARVVDRSEGRVVRDEFLVGDAGVGGPGPHRPTLGEPGGDSGEQGAVEAVRQLVGQPATQSLDRADRHAQRGHVAGLEAADPEEGRAFALQRRRLGHQTHEPGPSRERIAAVPTRQPRVVLLHGRGGAQERAVPAHGFDAVPALGRAGQAGIRRPSVLAGEARALVQVQVLESLDRPRLAGTFEEPRPGPRQHRLGRAARFRQIGRRGPLQILEARLGRDAAQHERQLRGAGEVAAGVGRVHLPLQRLQGRLAGTRGQRKPRRQARPVPVPERRRGVGQLAAHFGGPAVQHHALHRALGPLACRGAEFGQLGRRGGPRRRQRRDRGILR